MLSRSQSSIKNLMSSFGLNTITIIASFFATPLILNFLGDVRFGFYRTIFEWIGFSSIFSFSFLAFASQTMARQKTQSNSANEIGNYFSFGVKILIVSLPMAVLFIIFAPYILGASENLYSELRWSSAIGCLGLFFIPLLVIQSFLEAQNKSYIVNTAMTVQKLLVIFFSLLGAFLFKNIESQFVALFLGQLCFFLLIFRHARLKLVFRKSSLEYWKSLVPFIKMDAASKIGMSADTIIISILLGPQDVTKFYILVRLPAMLMGQLASLGNSVWAGFSQVYFEGNGASDLFLKLTKAVAIVASVCGGSIFLFNSDFLSLWLSQNYESNLAFNAIVAFNLYIITLISFLGWILTAAQGENEFAKASLLSSFANIAIGVGGTLYFGIIGPVIGSAVGYGIIKMVWILKAIQQKMQLLLRNLLEVVLLPLVMGMIYFYGIFHLRTMYKFYSISWAQLICFGFVSNFFYIVICWFVLLRSEERKYWEVRLLKRTKGAV